MYLLLSWRFKDDSVLELVANGQRLTCNKLKISDWSLEDRTNEAEVPVNLWNYPSYNWRRINIITFPNYILEMNKYAVLWCHGQGFLIKQIKSGEKYMDAKWLKSKSLSFFKWFKFNLFQCNFYFMQVSCLCENTARNTMTK